MAGKMAYDIVHFIVVQPIRTLFTIHLSALYFKIFPFQIFISAKKVNKTNVEFDLSEIVENEHEKIITNDFQRTFNHLAYILFVTLSGTFGEFRKFQFHTFENIIPNE